MPEISLRDAKTGFSSVVDEAIKGRIMTITRHGKPVAAVVSLEAAEPARQSQLRERSGFVSCLKEFPGEKLTRNPAPSRNIDL
ncbi:MAG: type II toxin-antitoxin system Phd/YefM family antitoxin [Boseongicola sp. SB0677_bin_26]|nr:type II toxin-antitoxin system Phd/YefM family antitoxin [Boseongicola sp. SB0665_bin_10]MYG26910.1 type II toxin-antitoxin system Phd/YefM family antitoxin [Boseongicola sp. SB0677_bin_26]